MATVTVVADGADADDLPDETPSSVWHFDLSQVVRDRHSNTQTGKVGAINEEDVEVVVDGEILEFDDGEFQIARVANTTQGCAVDPADAEAFLCDGGGYNRITLDEDPSDGFENVVITYKYSEYKFDAATTPIRLAGTRFFHGTEGYDAANTQVNIDTAGSGTITPTSGIDGTTIPEYVVINFAYHVEDFKKELVTFSSATAGERLLDMTETSPSSNVFQTKVALFNQADYQAITTEAANDENDKDENDKITLAEMVKGIETRMVTTGSGDDEVMTRVYDEGLETRVEKAITGVQILGAAGTVDTVAASKLVDRLAQVAHGDTLTVAYTDSSPAGNIVKTAEVDLEAPAVTLIAPVDGLYSNSTAHQLNVDVVDDGAGVEKEMIDLFATGMSLGADTAKAPIVDGFRITNVPSNISEGTKEWFCAS